MAHDSLAGAGVPVLVTAVEDDALGARLRSARRRARLSTRELAERAGVSAGFVSQVETGKRGVSVSALKRLADAVGLSAAELLSERPPVSRQVLRAAERPVFESETGLTKLLLSRTPLQQLEVYVGRFEVGGSTGEEPYSHDDAQEMFHVVAGHVEFTVGDDAFVLGPGDTLEYLSAVPHRAVNVGATPAEAFWITSHFSPPVDPNPASARPSQHTGQHTSQAHLQEGRQS
ncbi:helix-turn-helix domain-containing protein [Streptomyces sp. NP160]|uniref:helix-turn-helix domain-containing protein n=1 Tax=Streptomyces sp. NP160 TaxID=2586637 RepID=UPI00111B68C3|nr:XRE family transcriptional regulator [Streptomyces sp. NP160]TNM69711.1 helix-turn-helix domain-containing protein [Streptomyces sp. NP160]